MYSSNPEYVAPQVHSLDHQADSGPGQHEPTSSHLPPFHELIGSLSAPTDEASSPSSVASRRRISSTPSTPTAAAAYLDNLHESHCLRACHPHNCIQVEKYLKFDQIQDEPPINRGDWIFDTALNEIVQASSEIARFVDQCRHDLENGYRNPSEKQVNAILSSSMQIIRQLKAIRCAARVDRGRCCLESARRASTPPTSPPSSWGRSEQGDAPDEEDIPSSDPLHHHHRHHYRTSHDHAESSTRDDNDIDKSWAQLMDDSEEGQPKIPNSRSPVMSSTESPLGVYHFGKEQRPAEEAQLEQRRYYHQQQQLHHHQHERLQSQLVHYHSHHPRQHSPAQPQLVLNQQQSHPRTATESPSVTTGGKPTEPEPEPELAPPTSPGPRIELAQITIARAFSVTATNGSTSKSTSTPPAGDGSPTFATLFSPTTENSPRKRRLRGERERERPERRQHEPEAVAAAAASSKAEEEERALGGGPSRRPLRPYPYPYPYPYPFPFPFSYTQTPPPRPQMQMQMQMVPDTLNSSSSSSSSSRTKRSHPYPHEPQAPARSSPPHGPHLQTPITIISDSSRNGNGNGGPAAAAAAAHQVGSSILVPSAGISFFLNGQPPHPHPHRYQHLYQPPSYPARDQQDRSPHR